MINPPPLQVWDMAWTEPKYSRTQVDAAGDLLISKGPVLAEKRNAALEIMGNWRSSHIYPLRAIRKTLESRAKSVWPMAIVGRRLKRLSSIEVKLKRFPHMKLSQMQDIGGCRAVVKKPAEVYRLVEVYKANKSRSVHDFSKEKDYIADPKADGYRGYHLIYRYRSEAASTKIFSGHRIELQIRSIAQHAWATAVETVDAFTHQLLKSNIGDENWKRFFALTSSSIAMAEDSPGVPNTPESPSQLADELRALEARLRALNILEGLGVAKRWIGETKPEDAIGYILKLDTKARRIDTRPYTIAELQKANDDYLQLEKSTEGDPDIQVCFVSADKLTNLEKAFPNYYVDLGVFLGYIRAILADKET